MYSLPINPDTVAGLQVFQRPFAYFTLKKTIYQGYTADRECILKGAGIEKPFGSSETTLPRKTSQTAPKRGHRETRCVFRSPHTKFLRQHPSTRRYSSGNLYPRGFLQSSPRSRQNFSQIDYDKDRVTIDVSNKKAAVHLSFPSTRESCAIRPQGAQPNKLLMTQGRGGVLWKGLDSILFQTRLLLIGQLPNVSCWLAFKMNSPEQIAFDWFIKHLNQLKRFSVTMAGEQFVFFYEHEEHFCSLLGPNA